MEYSKDERPLSSLLGDLAQNTSDLMHKEVQLAKAEIGEKISQTKVGLTSVVLGGVLLIVGLIYLVQAIVYGLAEILPPDLSPWLAALIVGAVLCGIGVGFVQKGQSDLKPKNLMPEKTIKSVQENAEFVKEKIHE